MPITSYSSVAQVAVRYSIRSERTPFIEPIPAPLSEHFRDELRFTLANVPYDVSEAAARETLVYPVLRELWKPFSAALTLWNNPSLDFDDDLCGVPDFLVSRRSPLGATIPDQPYLLVVEAKKDDFPRGWAQCLAAMVAAQKLDDAPGRASFGIATNGRGWEFGRLAGDTFTQEPGVWGIQELDELAAAIHYLLIQCRDQAARLAVSA